MSERIKELVEQCYEKHELLGTYEFNKEKFAKLIVRECADWLSKREFASPEALKRHFGVKDE